MWSEQVLRVAIATTLVLTASAQNTTNPFAKIAASTRLTWSKCPGYTGFLCARLQVPLDYTKPHGEIVELAMVQYPAKNETKSSKIYQPSIIYNPGGPGVSGTIDVFANAPAYQKLLGEQYSIISFDPRGTGYTTPGYTCFPGSPLSRDIILAKLNQNRLNPDDSESFAIQYAYGKGYAKQCATFAKDGIGRHLSTPVVARDVLSIVEAEAVAHGLKAEEGKLWYWGVSYGTTLGQTFAALFPDRIGRMLLDGVVDTRAYYSGNVYTSATDVDKIYDRFPIDCHAAGKSRCTFYTGNSSAAIKVRLNKLYANLEESPLVVVRGGTNTGSDLFDVFTASDLKTLFFYTLYHPQTVWPVLAVLLTQIEKGDASAAAANLRVDYNSDCDVKHQVPEPQNRELTAAVLCNDLIPAGLNTSLAAVKNDTRGLIAQSSAGGEIWAKNILPCINWNVTQTMPFKGSIGGKTSFPILFFSNLYDPATPLAGARASAQRYTNASLVINNGIGHITISAPSTCVAGHYQRYLKEGVLPEFGTVCQPDAQPFLS